MELQSLITDDNAVSPVIGVILMVAITVILAAVIGAFVLGIGGSQEAAPQATLTFDFDDGSTAGFGSGDGDLNEVITVKHEGGDDIDTSALTFAVEGTEVTSNNTNSQKEDPQWTTSGAPSGTWSAGSSASITEDQTSSTHYIQSGNTVTVTWTSSSGDSSQIIAESDI